MNISKVITQQRNDNRLLNVNGSTFCCFYSVVNKLLMSLFSKNHEKTIEYILTCQINLLAQAKYIGDNINVKCVKRRLI